MNRPGIIVSALLFFFVESSFAASEWTWHRTNDGVHPDAHEQQMMWLMNRARSNPAAEGRWLANSKRLDVARGRWRFGVTRSALLRAFAAMPKRPPAAFDVRLYEASRQHVRDLIRRDSQDHNGQLDRVRSVGFNFRTWRGNVFSYANNTLNAHAAFNIDWGQGPDGMQNPPGHRIAIMSSDQGSYSNVGISAIEEHNAKTYLGDWVVASSYAQALENGVDHFNKFVVGTVWKDQNRNRFYDIGEGIGGVVVKLSKGAYYAVTSEGGGYAIPVTRKGRVRITFSGGGIKRKQYKVRLRNTSVLVDHRILLRRPR